MLDGPRSLPRLLVARAGVTMAQVDEALARQTVDGGDFVINLLEAVGPSGEGALRRALAEQTGLELAPAGELPEPPEGLGAKLPAELAARHGAVPFDERGGALCVAVDEPLPDELLAALAAEVGAPVLQYVAPTPRIRQALAREYGLPLDRRTARLLARLDGHDDPMPSPPPPAPTGPAGGATPARGLARWLHRASSPGAPAPRPAAEAPRLGAAEAEARILAAEDTAGALQSFFEFSRQYFRFAALFVLVADRALCFDRHERDAEPAEPPANLTLFLDGPGCLTHARDRKAPVCERLAKRGLDAELSAGLGRPPGALALAVPVLVRGRVAALLYADEGRGSVELSQAGEVIALASLLGHALERFALRRKRRAAPAAEGEAARAEGPRDSVTPPPPPADPEAPTQPPPSFPPASDDEPPRSLYVPPTPPPLPRHETALPSIIVTAPSELPHLLARLGEGGPGLEQVVERVRREGAAVAPLLLSRLPGPSPYRRGDLLAGGVRPRDAGPYFLGLTALGKDALPLLVARSANGAPSARFYATFLLGDFPYEEAAVAIAGRLFDPDADIRTIGRVAARHLGPDREVARPLAEALEGTLRDLLAGPRRRRLAAETLGELRLSAGLGVLVDALGDGDSSVVDVAHRALVVLTCHDFGHDAAAWRAFVRREGGRRRAHWLVDSLAHENATMRLLAAAELTPLLPLPGLTRFAMLSTAERAELQAVCRSMLDEQERPPGAPRPGPGPGGPGAPGGGEVAAGAGEAAPEGALGP